MQRKGALSSLLILASLLIALCALIGGGNIESTLDNILKPVSYTHLTLPTKA